MADLTAAVETLAKQKLHYEEECKKLRAINRDMYAMLRALITEIRKFHPTFDARLFVLGERLLVKAEVLK